MNKSLLMFVIANSFSGVEKYLNRIVNNIIVKIKSCWKNALDNIF